MLGERQDPLAGLLIRRTLDRGERADPSAMSNRSAGGANALLCPACARPMTRVRTIWRTVQDDLQVFECRACNVSVSAKVSPRPR
jgi:hypothetical protein